MRLLNFLSKAGVDWSVGELEKYQAREEPAITGTYGKTTLFTSSAPTSGPQFISLLNILSGFEMSMTDFLTLGYTHNLTEAMRISQVQVTRLGICWKPNHWIQFLKSLNSTGDPLFDANVTSFSSTIINSTFANVVRKQILPNAIIPDNPVPVIPEPAASVVSVMDNEEIYVAAVR